MNLGLLLLCVSSASAALAVLSTNQYMMAIGVGNAVLSGILATQHFVVFQLRKDKD